MLHLNSNIWVTHYNKTTNTIKLAHFIILPEPIVLTTIPTCSLEIPLLMVEYEAQKLAVEDSCWLTL
jgi:hypothetical protein